MKKGICPLCNKEEQLIKSHIIPEGFYSNMYDSKRTAIYASKSRKKVKVVQKGTREFLLCQKCDGEIIGKYDKYAIEVIRDKRHIKEKEYSNCVIWDNLDYDKFKLFHLSVLWRANLAKENAKGVELSEENSNKIREYILSGKAPESYDYPVFGFELIDPLNNYENCNEIVTYGNKYEMLCISTSETYSDTYVFIYGGIAWNYIVSKVKEDVFLERVALKKHGRILLQKENIRSFQPFIDVYDSIKMIGDKRGNITR